MHWKGQHTVAVNATSQQQKGKEMEKGDKTAQEKKIQHMVNDLIKMAERKGATYYGSWIEDGRQYVAGSHFCVSLSKPVELPEKDGSSVKKQIYDYMENARIMNEKEVKKELEKIESFKNITMSYNESKNIYDVYAKIRIPEEEVKDVFNDIENLEYTYCDCGIFEFYFSPENAEEVIAELQEKF